MAFKPLLLVCRCGGGGAGQVRCGGKGGAFSGPPFKMIGLILDLPLNGLPLLLCVFVNVDGGGGGVDVDVVPETLLVVEPVMEPPTRYCSRKAATLFEDEEVDGGWVVAGDEFVVVVDELISAALTAAYGTLDMAFKFEFEMLRAGVGGGGGLTVGGFGGATVGRPIGGFGAMRRPLLMPSCD